MQHGSWKILVTLSHIDHAGMPCIPSSDSNKLINMTKRAGDQGATAGCWIPRSLEIPRETVIGGGESFPGSHQTYRTLAFVYGPSSCIMYRHFRVRLAAVPNVILAFTNPRPFLRSCAVNMRASFVVDARVWSRVYAHQRAQRSAARVVPRSSNFLMHIVTRC